MENKELETWLKETKAKNLSLDELEAFMEYVPTCPHNTVWSKLKGETNEDKASILFNQWQKEKEFSPKRGDRVLVWDDTDINPCERIFIGIIEGAKNSYIAKCIDDNDKENNFTVYGYQYMKPLPTEKTFKEKVIEVIEAEKNKALYNRNESVKSKNYLDAHDYSYVWIIYNNIVQKIKEL